MTRPSFAPSVRLLLLLAGAAFLPAAAVWADTPAEQYKEASQLYNAHLYSTAAPELKAFVDANPADPNAKLAAYQWAGALYRAKNGAAGVDYASATKAYEWALQKYPTAPANIVAAARFELGEAYYLSQKPDKTIAALTRFLASPGTDAGAATRLGWANYYVGKSYGDLKKPALARAAFEAVRAHYGATEAAPDALLELGLLDLDAAKPGEAATLFADVRAKFPDSDAAPEARVHLGEAQLGLKEYPAARATLRAALADPKAADFKSDALLLLADTDFADKQWSDAAHGYDALLQSLPAADTRRPATQLARGNAYFNAKEWAAALDSYAPLLQSGEKTGAPALYYSANSLAEQGKLPQAAALYRQLVASFPAHLFAPKAALRLGDVLVSAKEPAQAAQAYKAVLTRFPGSESAKAAQSALVDMAGTAGAGDAVEAALRGLPAGMAGGAQLRLAQAAFDRGDFAKSAQLAGAVAAAKPDAATTESALFLVASAKLNAKDAAGAATAFTAQLAAFPKGKLAAQGQLGLAWANADQKKWPESERAARAALAAGGDKDRAQLALASALLRGGKFAPAVAAFTVVEASADKTFAAQGALGAALALEKQNLWHDAAAKWAKRAALLPDGDDKAGTFLHQGGALGKAKEYAPAQLAFDAAVGAAPKSAVGAQALDEAAWLAHDSGQADVESARWTRLETEFPDSKQAPEAVFQAGELASHSKKWSDAATIYTRLLQKYPKDELAPRAQFGLATALYNAEQWTQAAEAFDGVAASKELMAPEAPFWAAESFRKAGDPVKAAPRYARFVQAVEGNAAAPAALKAMARVARLGWGQCVTAPSEAASIYQPALAAARGKTKTELQYRLGAALAAQSKWAAALPILLPVATGDSEWHAPAQWLAAQSLENTGAKADALALYQKLAASSQPDEWSAKAAARVKALAP